MWPVCYSRWNVFLFSCDDHRCDGNYKYLIENLDSHITCKLMKWPSQCCKPFGKSDNKWLRYSKIGSKNSNMLENASQHIACNFTVSQELWNVPSQVYSVWLGLMTHNLQDIIPCKQTHNSHALKCPFYCIHHELITYCTLYGFAFLFTGIASIYVKLCTHVVSNLLAILTPDGTFENLVMTCNRSFNMLNSLLAIFLLL